MSPRLSIARWFLLVGVLLAVIGLVLWFTLPFRSTFPPFVATAVLALGYGGFCEWRDRFPGARKP
jgi:hypothetical protein